MYRSFSIALLFTIASSTMLVGQSASHFQSQENVADQDQSIHWPNYFNPFWFRNIQNLEYQNEKLNQQNYSNEGWKVVDGIQTEGFERTVDGQRGISFGQASTQFGATQQQGQFNAIEGKLVDESTSRSQNREFVPAANQNLQRQQQFSQQQLTNQGFEYTTPQHEGVLEAPVNPVQIQIGQTEQQQIVQELPLSHQVTREYSVQEPATTVQSTIETVEVQSAANTALETSNYVAPGKFVERKNQESAVNLDHHSNAHEREFVQPVVPVETVVVDEQVEFFQSENKVINHDVQVIEVQEADAIIPAAVVETTDRVKQKASLVAPIRQHAKTTRVAKTTTRRKSSAASLWAFLPLLLLPLLGWLGWKWFGGQNNTTSYESAPQSESSVRYQEPNSAATTLKQTTAQRKTVPAQQSVKSEHVSTEATAHSTTEVGRQQLKTVKFEQELKELPASNCSIQAKQSTCHTVSTEATAHCTTEAGQQQLKAVKFEQELKELPGTSNSSIQAKQQSTCHTVSTEATAHCTTDAGQQQLKSDLPKLHVDEVSETSQQVQKSNLNSIQEKQTFETPRSIVADKDMEQIQLHSEVANVEGTAGLSDKKTSAQRLGSRTQAQSTQAQPKKTSEQANLQHAESFQSASCDMDDLTKIQGIDAAMATRLRETGITSYRELYNTGPEMLSRITSGEKSLFGSADLTRWVQQASFAMSGDWQGLGQWQVANPTAQLVESGRKEFTCVENNGLQGEAQDLTKIKGIGAAAQKVLAEHGILRFEQIGQMNCDQLEAVFADCKDRFRSLNFETWAQQAQAILGTSNSGQDLSLETDILDSINTISAKVPQNQIVVNQD